MESRQTPVRSQSRIANDQGAWTDVLDALRGIRFGSVQITLHEGRVVEIQKTERIRPASCCRPQ